MNVSTSDGVSSARKTGAGGSPSGSPRNSAAFARGVLSGALGASTPPAAASVDVGALTARNRDLSAFADRTRVRAAEQTFCLQQAMHVRALGVVMSLSELKPADGALVQRIGACASKLEATENVVAHADTLIGELERVCCEAQDVGAPGAPSLRAIERASRATAAAGMIDTLRNIQSMRTDLRKRQDERDANLKRIYDAMLTTFVEHFDPTHFGIALGCAVSPHQQCDICGNEYNACEPARQQLLLACCQLKQSCCVECVARVAYTGSNFARKRFFHCAFCRTELRLYGQLESAR